MRPFTVERDANSKPAGPEGRISQASYDGPLPNPSTYSLNARTIQEAPIGYTSFNGNGTIYTLDTPEPFTFRLVWPGVIAMLILSRRRVARCPR